MSDQNENVQEELTPHLYPTVEVIRTHMISNGKFPYKSRECSICGSALKYTVDHLGELYFDSTCACTSYGSEPEHREWKELVEHFLAQTNIAYKNELIEHFGLSFNSTNGPNYVPPIMNRLYSWSQIPEWMNSSGQINKKAAAAIMSVIWVTLHDNPHLLEYFNVAYPDTWTIANLLQNNCIPFPEETIMRIMNGL